MKTYNFLLDVLTNNYFNTWVFATLALLLFIVYQVLNHFYWLKNWFRALMLLAIACSISLAIYLWWQENGKYYSLSQEGEKWNELAEFIKDKKESEASSNMTEDIDAEEKTLPAPATTSGAVSLSAVHSPSSIDTAAATPIVVRTPTTAPAVVEENCIETPIKNENTWAKTRLDAIALLDRISQRLEKVENKSMLVERQINGLKKKNASTFSKDSLMLELETYYLLLANRKKNFSNEIEAFEQQQITELSLSSATQMLRHDLDSLIRVYE